MNVHASALIRAPISGLHPQKCNYRRARGLECHVTCRPWRAHLRPVLWHQRPRLRTCAEFRSRMTLESGSGNMAGEEKTCQLCRRLQPSPWPSQTWYLFLLLDLRVPVCDKVFAVRNSVRFVHNGKYFTSTVSATVEGDCALRYIAKMPIS